MHKILVIEDNKEMVLLFKKILEKKFELSCFTNAEEGLHSFYKHYFDIILLDIGLPDQSGLEICNEVRSSSTNSNIPIIIISAQTSKKLHIMSYKLGANVFLDKPFDQEELLALIESQINRNSNSPMNTTIISYNDLFIDLKKSLCQIKDHPITLTKKELNILKLLINRKGEPVSRNEILTECWPDNLEISDRAIDYHISILRKKITLSETSIKAVYSEGYVLYKKNN